MTVGNHLVNKRQFSTFSPLEHELSYEPQKNYLFDLSYLKGLHVTGDKAKEFLQGQVSCDVREVTNLQMRQGALCNLKGRILALLDIIDWAAMGVHLILPADLLPETQASLAKTAIFSRVTLRPADNYQLFGLYLQNPEDLIPFDVEPPTTALSVVSNDDYYCYYLGDNLYIYLVKTNKSAAIQDNFIKKSQWRGSLAWHALQLQQKRIEIYPESRGMFLPHRLGLQLSGYLSFNKGCYKGQEIIARTHYRAKLKHELRLFIIQTTEALQSGQKFFEENNDIEIGELVDYCSLSEGRFLIAASVVFSAPKKIRLEDHQQVIELIDFKTNI